MVNHEWASYCSKVRNSKVIIYCGLDGELIIRKFEPDRPDPYGYKIVGVYSHRQRKVIEEDIAACLAT